MNIYILNGSPQNTLYTKLYFKIFKLAKQIHKKNLFNSPKHQLEIKTQIVLSIYFSKNLTIQSKSAPMAQ
jgi:hypothetical protein